MRDLWLARNTCVEMVIDRGYTTKQEVLTYPQFTALYPSAQSSPTLLNFVAQKDASIAVHFTFDDKLPKKNIEMIVQEYINQNIPIVVLVTVEKLNASCKAFLKSAKINVEHFLIEELMFNVTKHSLVPKHSIMSEEDGAVLLKNLKATKAELPSLLLTDPVNRYIGGRPGDIVKIIRNSSTTGTSLYYRVIKE